MFLGLLEIWWMDHPPSFMVGFGINGEYVGSQTGYLARTELYPGESVTHVTYGVGHHLKFFLTLFLELP